MASTDRSDTRFPTRRDLLVLGLGAFVVAAVPLAARRRRMVRRSVPVMGTVADLVVVHRDAAYAHAALDAAVAALGGVEHRMTRFTTTSEVGRVNAAAGTARAVPISGETALVLEAALAWASKSDGAFDPCLGRVVATWDVLHRREPPAARAVTRLADRRLYRTLDVDRLRGTPVARLTEPDAALDLGGIAKGYGVDRAAAVLRDWGIRDALVNVGGDLYALGTSEDGDPWRVGIRSPDDPERLIGQLALSDAAVATSGDYLQYFEYRGRRYHHLMDPATAAPRASATHSVTVTAPTCLDADPAATACFGMAAGTAERVLRVVAPGATLM